LLLGYAIQHCGLDGRRRQGFLILIEVYHKVYLIAIRRCVIATKVVLILEQSLQKMLDFRAELAGYKWLYKK